MVDVDVDGGSGGGGGVFSMFYSILFSSYRGINLVRDFTLIRVEE